MGYQVKSKSRSKTRTRSRSRKSLEPAPNPNLSLLCLCLCSVSSVSLWCSSPCDNRLDRSNQPQSLPPLPLLCVLCVSVVNPLAALTTGFPVSPQPLLPLLLPVFVFRFMERRSFRAFGPIVKIGRNIDMLCFLSGACPGPRHFPLAPRHFVIFPVKVG